MHSLPTRQACLENVVGDIEIPDHPLVDETMRDCLHEFMDIDGLVEVLAGIESRAIEVVARETTEPSPLSHEIINANPYAYLDALESPKHDWVIGVQWHNEIEEEMPKNFGNLFQALIERAETYAQRRETSPYQGDLVRI